VRSALLGKRCDRFSTRDDFIFQRIPRWQRRSASSLLFTTGKLFAKFIHLFLSSFLCLKNLTR